MTLSPDSIYHTTFEEMAYEITSTAENSTKDWTTVYPYLEDIGDGRGYTCGLVGFTTADGDLLDVVNAYTALEPGNQLATYTSALETLKADGEGSSAGSQADSLLGSSFKTRWANLNVSDPLLRQAQRQIRDAEYWMPAFNQAISDQVQGLGLAILYDIWVNHGPGTDPESAGGIVATAQSKAPPPSAGGSESAYLSALVNAREAVLQLTGDDQPDGRVAAHRALIATGNLTLATPFSWSMYGDSFTMATRPALPAEAERPNALEPGAPSDGGGGGTGGGNTTTPGSAPGSLFDLTPWYLTPPVTSGGATGGTAAEIDQPALNTYASAYFQLDGTADMVFTAPVVGATTSGSSSSRTELREMENGVHADWPIATASRQLTVTAKWDATSTDTQTMIVGQIHGSSGTPPIYLLVDYTGGSTAGILKLFANGPSVGNLLTGISPSTECTYRITVGGGQVKLYACVGKATALPATPLFTFNASYFSDNADCYMKFGAYNKSTASGGGPGAAITTCSRYELVQNGVAYAFVASTGGTGGTGGGTGTLDPVQGPDSTRAAYTQGWGPAVAGDEFDYTGGAAELTAKGWNVYNGAGHAGNGTRDPSAWSVQDGYVRCTGTAGMSTGGMDFEPNSNGGYSAQYYRVECRMRITPGTDNGGAEYHPVLILWPDGSIPWPQGGEYDYAETDVNANNPPMSAFMHHPSSDQGDQNEYDYNPAGGFDLTQWHNYALEWSHTSGLTGYIDGVKWFNDPNSANSNAMHQTIQMDSFFSTGTLMRPATMDVAWFRAYPLTGTGSIGLERYIGGGSAGGGSTGGGTGGGGLSGGDTGGGTTGGGTGGNTGGGNAAAGSSGTTTGIESFFAPVTFSERLVTAADLQTLPSNLNTLCRLTTGKTSGATPTTKPVLRLARAASYTIGTSQTLITWDTEVYDSDGMWASGTPTLITIQTAGWYWITLQVSFASGSASQRQCSLLVNGTTDPTNTAAQRDEWLGATSLAHIQCQLYDHFQVGDVIRGYALSGTSLSSDSTEGGTWLYATWDAPY